MVPEALLYFCPRVSVKTPQNHAQINFLPFLMWQLFTAFHTKLHEGQKRQKMGEKGFFLGEPALRGRWRKKGRLAKTGACARVGTPFID